MPPVGSVSGVPSSAKVTALVYDSRVGSENLTPLVELKLLDRQIDAVHSLAGLQPMFARVEEINKQFTSDFEIQLVAHEVKQHILTRGMLIRQLRPVVPLAVAPVEAAPPLAQPPPEPVVAELPLQGDVEPEAVPQKARRGKALAWVFAALVALAGIAIAVNVIHDRNLKLAATTPVDAGIHTVPPGAAIAIDGQPTCKSDCVAKLVPGKYKVTATLDGYDAADGQLTVSAGQAAALKLTLVAQPPSLRIFADLTTGQVFLDDASAGELQDGQFTLERVAPGPHSIRVAGPTSEASFKFNAAMLTMPTVDGPITTKDLLAVLVANIGGKARMVTSSGPYKLSVNGQREADATPDGIDLTGFRTGAGELVLGEGKEQRTLTATFSGAPTLTAFLKTDQQIGTLLITTGQDDVRIFINNKEHRRRTVKGQARVQTFGEVTVKVEKPGFEPVPAQSLNVAQGTETRLTFAMKLLPQFGSLSINGGAPGTQIFVSERQIGSVGNDGTFRNTSIAPGEHSIELRREQFEPKRLTRTFRAGETVAIGAAESALAPVRVAPPPPVVILAPPKPEPPPVKTVAPRLRVGDISNFDNPSLWQQDKDVWKHRGAGALTYALPPNGIFTFSIYMLKGGGLLRAGKVRWFVNYTDDKNYALFELDDENFWSKVVVNGKTQERKRVAHKQDKSMRVWNIQIVSSPTRLTHKIQGDDGWVDLDAWTEPGRDFTRGKFGILVTGTDEVGLSNFTFTP
jgi:hypothetical protein